ncbi:MAG: hypothetical protein NTZ33_14305 [Bacteroidetes bacterium]|nr:hypothetical protein [Bacteroidota bacterium]
MYTDRLKLKLRGLGVTYLEAAESIGMGDRGFKLAMKKETFSFKNMLLLSHKYGFSLDELGYEDESNNVGESLPNYTKKENKYTLNYENAVPFSIYKESNAKYEQYINNLQGQVEFLKKLLEEEKQQH